MNWADWELDDQKRDMSRGLLEAEESGEWPDGEVGSRCNFVNFI